MRTKRGGEEWATIRVNLMSTGTKKKNSSSYTDLSPLRRIWQVQKTTSCHNFWTVNIHFNQNCTVTTSGYKQNICWTNKRSAVPSRGLVQIQTCCTSLVCISNTNGLIWWILDQNSNLTLPQFRENFLMIVRGNNRIQFWHAMLLEILLEPDFIVTLQAPCNIGKDDNLFIVKMVFWGKLRVNLCRKKMIRGFSTRDGLLWRKSTTLFFNKDYLFLEINDLFLKFPRKLIFLYLEVHRVSSGLYTSKHQRGWNPIARRNWGLKRLAVARPVSSFCQRYQRLPFHRG